MTNTTTSLPRSVSIKFLIGLICIRGIWLVSWSAPHLLTSNKVDFFVFWGVVAIVHAVADFWTSWELFKGHPRAYKMAGVFSITGAIVALPFFGPAGPIFSIIIILLLGTDYVRYFYHAPDLSEFKESEKAKHAADEIERDRFSKKEGLDDLTTPFGKDKKLKKFLVLNKNIGLQSCNILMAIAAIMGFGSGKYIFLAFIVPLVISYRLGYGLKALLYLLGGVALLVLWNALITPGSIFLEDPKMDHKVLVLGNFFFIESFIFCLLDRHKRGNPSVPEYGPKKIKCFNNKWIVYI